MANSVSEVLLTKARLEAPKDDVDPEAGAIVDFWGVVRKLEGGREIEGIDYEAHTEMAQHQLRLITECAMEKFELRKIILHHRIGFVRTGEASLWLQVRAQHREAAFAASLWIVDELKKRVPIWKRPRYKIDNQEQPRLPIPATA